MAADWARPVVHWELVARDADRVVQLGGKATSEPFDLPAGPTLAFIEDPEGNPVTLVQQ
jgi:predicted enzyme related to lactoylglutathione lyase